MMNMNHDNDPLVDLLAELPLRKAPAGLNARILSAAAAFEKKRKRQKSVLLWGGLSVVALCLVAGGYFILYYFDIAFSWPEWFPGKEDPAMALPKISFPRIDLPMPAFSLPTDLQSLVVIGPLLILSVLQLWVGRKLARHKKI